MDAGRPSFDEFAAGLSVFDELRPDPTDRYRDGWQPRHDYLTIEFSFADKPWTEAVPELDAMNGAEAYLATFTPRNFVYFLPVYLSEILELIAADEPPFALEYLLSSLAKRSGPTGELQAFASQDQLAWLRRFAGAIAAGYDLADDPEDNEAVRDAARTIVAQLSSAS